MDTKFRQLIEIGAGDFEHTEPDLIAGLEGARCLLKSWAAPEVCQHAALYLAAYSHFDFAQEPPSLTKRHERIAILGKEVEALIFAYHNCDLDALIAFFMQDSQGPSKLPVRYPVDNEATSRELISDLCHLIAAVEVDKALYKKPYCPEQKTKWQQAFSAMHQQLSGPAKRKVEQVFGY